MGEGILYFSETYKILGFRCPCGCEDEILVDHDSYNIQIEDNLVSVGIIKRSFGCESEFTILNNQIIWA